MPLSQADRISFSLQIIQTPTKIATLTTAAGQISSSITSAQSADTANSNLFNIPNILINGYQAEANYLDGNVRTTILEQDFIDSANKKLQNHFFPNDTSVSVPSLSDSNNVWTQIPPFALSYAVGKNYTQSYATITSEPAQIGIVQALIIDDPMSHLDAAVSALIAILTPEVAAIVANDPNPANQSNNNAAIANINSVMLPACNGFLGGTVTSSQLATILTTRSSFIATRLSQINAVLGTIAQDVTSGVITSSSGFYGQRYGSISLRLGSLDGSLTVLAGLQATSKAQTSIIASTKNNSAMFQSVVATTPLLADGNGTNLINVMDSSRYNVGDTVYIYSETQTELQRAIARINNSAVTLNDIIPAKYRVIDGARMYKDLT